MRASFRDRIGRSAAMLLGMAGLLSLFAPSIAKSDDGIFDSGAETYWKTVGTAGVDDDEDAPWIKIRINALYLNRKSPQPNVVLTETATGNSLLATDRNDPSWAGGVETNLLLNIAETTDFEFDWFSVDDWFDRKSVNYANVAVNEVPFPVNLASVSVSSRVRNMEFNLREDVTDRLTLIGGFRFVDFLDAQGIHYQNITSGASEVIVTDTTNRLYGFQIGANVDLYESESWALSTWGKVGAFGNAANNSTGIFSTVPGNAQNIRAQDGKSAFLGELGVRGTRRWGDHIEIFVGYRLLYLDGVALAANQYSGTVNYLQTGIPSIKMANSILFQGIEAGMVFKF